MRSCVRVKMRLYSLAHTHKQHSHSIGSFEIFVLQTKQIPSSSYTPEKELNNNIFSRYQSLEHRRVPYHVNRSKRIYEHIRYNNIVDEHTHTHTNTSHLCVCVLVGMRAFKHH